MKIFIGGLPHDLSQEELKSFFGSFGTITDIIIIHNKETNKSRGFGFVTFDSEEVAQNVLQNRFYFLKNKRVEVKKAKPKERVLISPSLEPFRPNLSVKKDLHTYFPPYPQYYYNTYNYLSHYGAWFGGNMNYYWPESRFGQNPFYPYDFCTPGYYYYYEHSRFGHTTNQGYDAWSYSESN